MLLPEVHAKIVAQGWVDTGFVVVRGFLPSTPNTVIALYETGGLAPDRFLMGGVTVDRPAMQVVVRGAPNDYATPRLQMEKIYQGLIGLNAFTQDGTKYINFTPLQAPFLFDRDENERVKFAVNFLVWKEFSPTV